MKQSFVVAVFVAIGLQTIVTALPPIEFQNIGANHHRQARSTEAKKAKNLPATNLKEAAAVDGVQQLERYNTYQNALPAHVYPNSEFVSYSTNCEMGAFDLYAISGVTDAIKCGNEFCSGDRRCTHFVYVSTTSTCYIKNRYGFGTADWTTNVNGFICGLIPSRACNTNVGSMSNLLSCLSLKF